MLFRSLTEESFAPEKENVPYTASTNYHHEFEMALQSKGSLSRPGSRRALSTIDLNVKVGYILFLPIISFLGHFFHHFV